MQRLRLMEKLQAPLMLLPAFAVLTLLFAGGMVVGLGQSLGYMPVIGLTNFTLQYYFEVLVDPNFLQSLWVTFRIALVSTVLSMALAVPIP